MSAAGADGMCRFIPGVFPIGTQRNIRDGDSFVVSQSARAGRYGILGRKRHMAQETNLMVWIDQDLCTGDGICEEITPEVFTARDDGLWVVKEEEKNFGRKKVFDGDDGPDGAQGMARIPDHLHEDAMESAEECPGECIFIEPYNEEAIAS